MKIQNAISKKGKRIIGEVLIRRGKSGGYRLLYHFDEETGTVSLLLLYAKSDRENITQGEIHGLLEELSDTNSL